MKKQAFTIAEVMLTVAVIGIVAAVTTPAITTSNQNKKFNALAKKAQATLQIAIDNKMSYTLSRPSGDSLFDWLIAGSEFGHDTIKFVGKPKNIEVITTPDGMVYYARRTGGGDGKLKYTGEVYVDLNGSDGPTHTTVDNGTNIRSVANSVVNFDVITFEVTRDGDVTPANAKARKYLDL